jgi:adenylyl-sulfate kinase
MITGGPRIIWLTGCSGSGKTTIAGALKKELDYFGILSYVLDGDVLRNGLNSDLGLSEKDRNENIRRAYEVANILADLGAIVICAFISPYEEMRKRAKNSAKVPFIEVYLDCPIEECARRDPKGLYAKQKAGLIKGLTGVDAPYEKPKTPDLILKTKEQGVKKCVEEVVSFLSS